MPLKWRETHRHTHRHRGLEEITPSVRAYAPTPGVIADRNVLQRAGRGFEERSLCTVLHALPGYHKVLSVAKRPVLTPPS